jgi:hypothetical protein
MQKNIFSRHCNPFADFKEEKKNSAVVKVWSGGVLYSTCGISFYHFKEFL